MWSFASESSAFGTFLLSLATACVFACPRGHTWCAHSHSFIWNWWFLPCSQNHCQHSTGQSSELACEMEQRHHCWLCTLLRHHHPRNPCPALGCRDSFHILHMLGRWLMSLPEHLTKVEYCWGGLKGLHHQEVAPQMQLISVWITAVFIPCFFLQWIQGCYLTITNKYFETSLLFPPNGHTYNYLYF